MTKDQASTALSSVASSMAKALRQEINEGTLLAPGAYDPLTARLVANAGFPAVYVGGWMTGAQTCITEPLLTMTEQLAAAQTIAKAVPLPVIVDAHTGYGSGVHAARTVLEFEAAGIAAIHIEDQLFPKRMGYHRGRKEVIPLEEAVIKFKAALAARRDPDFLVIARTDAWGAENGGLDETVRRMEAFAGAGAEVLMPLVFDPDEAKVVRDSIPELPMVWLAGLGGLGLSEVADQSGQKRSLPELSVDDIRDIGYSIILYPLATILASVTPVNELLHEIARTGVCDVAQFSGAKELIESMSEIEKLVSMEEAAIAKS